MKRNVKKFAELGEKRIKPQFDIFTNEIQQLYAIANNPTSSDSMAIYDVMITAFYFGVEVGILQNELPTIAEDTTVSQLRKMLDQATPEHYEAIKDVIENLGILLENE